MTYTWTRACGVDQKTGRDISLRGLKLPQFGWYDGTDSDQRSTLSLITIYQSIGTNHSQGYYRSSDTGNSMRSKWANDRSNSEYSNYVFRFTIQFQCDGALACGHPTRL